jgi:FkbM family methyltransferase
LTPLISVAMPTRGRSNFVRRAVASVLDQSFTDFEVLILDNSPPNEKENIRELSRSDSRIKFIDRGDTGVTDARKLGASLSHGVLFSLLDSDDYWDRDRLAKHIEVWRRNRIGLSWDKWAEVNHGVANEFAQPFSEGTIKPPSVAARLYSFNFIHASAGIVLTRFANELGFPITNIMSSDWTLFMRAAEYYSAYFINECLSYKENDAPERVSNSESREVLESEVRIIRRWALLHRPGVYGYHYARKKAVAFLKTVKRLPNPRPHEPDLMRALASIRGKLFVDVGANRGQFAIPLSHHFDKVIAIEPNPSLIISGQNIEVLRFALSNRSGEANLYLDQHPVNPNWTLDTIMENFAYRPGYDPRIVREIRGKTSIKVATITLDEILSGISNVDLLKIDVEGAEFLVLEGGKQSLSTGKIANVAVEVHNRDRRKEMELLLREYEYKVRWVDEDHVVGRLTTSNC